jgi:hypothetical protein
VHSRPREASVLTGSSLLQVENIEYIAPPGPQEVVQASAKAVLRRLDNVDPEIIEFFSPAARTVLAGADAHDAMARALAALSGIMEIPKQRRCAKRPDSLPFAWVLAPPFCGG